MFKNLITTATIIALSIPSLTNAAILSGTSPAGFTELSGTIGGVGNNNHQAVELFAFNEVQNYTLATDLTIGGNTITAGTTVSSHYVFIDPKYSTRISGSVTFDGDILGVITNAPQLSDTNSIFGNTTAIYQSPSLLGLESGDLFSILNSTISIDFAASSPGDYIRVLTTSPVPIPAAVWLFGSGLIGLIGTRKKSRA